MTVNDIREALGKLGRMLGERPEKARARNAPATARMVGGLRCEVRGPGGEVQQTDMPPALGGAASAPTPGWLFRASLASCTATTIAMRAAMLGIELTTLEVTVEADSDTRGMLGLDETVSAGLAPIRMRVRIGAAGASAEQLRELVEWGDRHSVVGCTVRSAPGYALDVAIA